MIAALLLELLLAQQLTIVDETYTHSAETTTDSHYRIRLAATPANWAAPVDYAHGTLHVQMQVLTKPSAEPTIWNYCFEWIGAYSCAILPAFYTAPGTYVFKQPFSTFTGAGVADWTRRPLDVALILKDQKFAKPSPENVGAARAALFMPTQIRIVMTMVAAGSTYLPASVDGGLARDAAAYPDVPAPDATVTRERPAADTLATEPPRDAAPPTAVEPSSPSPAISGCSLGGQRSSAAAVLLMLMLLLPSARVIRPRTRSRGS
jgi:hypothetical protein